LTLGSIATVIHPYPTIADAIRKSGDSYIRSMLTPDAKKWLQRYLTWRFGGK
jgi:hypothetical protein